MTGEDTPGQTPGRSVRTNGGARVPRRSFEALLAGLGPAHLPALREALRGLGVDPDALHERYPLSLWRRALEAAAAIALPQLPEAEAQRQLGARVVRGFSTTVVGRVFALAAPLLGPERCMGYMPRYLSAAREDLVVDARMEGPRRWTLDIRDVEPRPYFVAGSVEAVLRLAHAEAHAELTAERPGGYTLRVTWPEL